MHRTGSIESILDHLKSVDLSLAQQETETLALRERVKALEGRRCTLDTITTVVGQVPSNGLSHPTDKRGVLRSIWQHLIDNPPTPKAPDTESIWQRLTARPPSTRTAP